MTCRNMEKDNQPGSARLGNFINYYSFNPPDRRISLLPRDLVTEVIAGSEGSELCILDIGCNTGDLTCALYQHLTTMQLCTPPSGCIVHMLGVDVDPVLIERAQLSNMHANHIKFEALNILDAAKRDAIVKEFLSGHKKVQFDATFAFSVSMWIHLNNGDQGLRNFLKYVSTVSNTLILEPQPWKCYRTAVRRMKKLGCEPFEHFESLTWRTKVEEEIEEYLTRECDMKLTRRLGQTQDWDRSVIIFQRVKTAAEPLIATAQLASHTNTTSP